MASMDHLLAKHLIQILSEVGPVGLVVLKEPPVHSDRGGRHGRVRAVAVYLLQQAGQAGRNHGCAPPGHQMAHLLHLRPVHTALAPCSLAPAGWDRQQMRAWACPCHTPSP